MANNHAHAHASDPAKVTDPIDAPASIVTVFLIVGALSVVNLVVSSAGLSGPITITLQLLIACVQAAFIARSWMHLKQSDTVTRLSVGSAIFFMAILFILILSDMLSRQYGSTP